MLAHSMSLHQLIFAFGKQRMMAEESFVTADQRYPVGTLILHAIRGPGVVREIDYTDTRNRPFIVAYDNGEVHHYTAESAMKLTVTQPVKPARKDSMYNPKSFLDTAAMARRRKLPEILGRQRTAVRGR
jgi:hypothetical protein